MREGTTAEVVVVVAALGVVAWLWHANRANGAGTGTASLPALGGASGPLPRAAPLFDLPAPMAGYEGSYQPTTFALPAPLSFGPGTPGDSGCNCADATQRGATFGGNADLTAWLAGFPGMVQNALDGLARHN